MNRDTYRIGPVRQRKKQQSTGRDGRKEQSEEVAFTGLYRILLFSCFMRLYFHKVYALAAILAYVGRVGWGRVVHLINIFIKAYCCVEHHAISVSKMWELSVKQGIQLDP